PPRSFPSSSPPSRTPPHTSRVQTALDSVCPYPAGMHLCARRVPAPRCKASHLRIFPHRPHVPRPHPHPPHRIPRRPHPHPPHRIPRRPPPVYVHTPHRARTVESMRDDTSCRLRKLALGGDAAAHAHVVCVRVESRAPHRKSCSRTGGARGRGLVPPLRCSATRPRSPLPTCPAPPLLPPTHHLLPYLYPHLPRPTLVSPPSRRRTPSGRPQTHTRRGVRNARRQRRWSPHARGPSLRAPPSRTLRHLRALHAAAHSDPAASPPEFL
ncbi:hypothetical protein C8F04DRAFT_1324259, partial [Mycena alexandri]